MNPTLRLSRVIFAPLLVAMVLSVGCSRADNSNNSAKASPANTAVVVKPTEPEAKQSPAAPAGKEIEAAEGPALRSITPPDGAVIGGVLNALAISLPTPDPAAAKETKESGKVTVEVLVNEKGDVSTSSVVSGPQPLWRAAGEAARQAKFPPFLKDGKPVKVAGVLTYEFAK